MNSLSSKKDWFSRILSLKNSKYVNIIVFLLVIGFLTFIGFLIFICWFVFLSKVANYGFVGLKWDSLQDGLLSILMLIAGLIGIIALCIFPILPMFMVGEQLDLIINRFSDQAEEVFEEKRLENQQKQLKYERILEEDPDKLIVLVNYSRIELEQYYNIGLSQTKKSYKSSIIAMWIGFIILIFGIIFKFLPVEISHDKTGNFQILTISSGIVTELISALFLWIYKSSKDQLTYFYSRQVFIHNALLAYKISTTMEDPDVSKGKIIEKILEFGLASAILMDKDSSSERKSILPGFSKDNKKSKPINH